MRSAVVLSLLAGSAFAQDMLHYKFESNCGAEVINYATGPSALGPGTLATASTTNWVPGVFGDAMAGWSPASTNFNRVMTGWTPANAPLTGDLTLAFFIKQRPGTTVNYIYGNTGGFRLFTGGIGGRGLYQRLILASGGNGINSSITNDFYLPAANADIQTLAASNWCHVAIVVDATAGTADWYVNGTSVLQLTGVGGALINAAGEFTVGSWSNSNSAYDIDEFVLSNRAFTAVEIMTMQLAPRGGAGNFTHAATQCGSTLLDGAGGPPSLGSTTHALTLGTPFASYIYSIVVGTSRCTFANTFPLPLDAGLLNPIAAGCRVLVDTNLGSLDGVAFGNHTQLFPVPNRPIFAGYDLFLQAAVIDVASLTLQASNARALGIGF